jgi:hypothetical protein
MLLKFLKQKLLQCPFEKSDSLLQAIWVSASMSDGSGAVNNAGTKPHPGEGIP